MIHILWGENVIVDILSKLSKTKKPYLNKIFIEETLANPNIEIEFILMMELDMWKGWMSLIIKYLTSEWLPTDEWEGRKIKRIFSWYIMIVEMS